MDERELISKKTVAWMARILKPLRSYHQHSVEGLRYVPKKGAAILATNHSLATYDALLLGMEIFEERARLLAGLGDNLLFKIPFLKQGVEALGVEPAGPGAARRLLSEGRIVGLLPGGMRESLRPSRERYQTRWQKRRGFVRLAIEAQVPIILCACPAADDIYTVYPSVVTKVGYKKLKLPLPIARGLGVTAVPRPVRLTHYLAPAIAPPPLDAARLEEQVEEFHPQVLAAMDRLMARALKAQK